MAASPLIILRDHLQIRLKDAKFPHLTCDFFGKSEEEKMAEMQAKQSLKNGKSLKQVLTALKENRDQIEQSTGKRPEIDDTTKLFMQKVLNVWLSEGRDIDDEKFWEAVDYNKQFDYPVEYYER